MGDAFCNNLEQHYHLNGVYPRFDILLISTGPTEESRPESYVANNMATVGYIKF